MPAAKSPLQKQIAKIETELKKAHKTGAHLFRLEAVDTSARIIYRTLKKKDTAKSYTFAAADAEAGHRELARLVHKLNEPVR